MQAYLQALRVWCTRSATATFKRGGRAHSIGRGTTATYDQATIAMQQGPQIVCLIPCYPSPILGSLGTKERNCSDDSSSMVKNYLVQNLLFPWGLFCWGPNRKGRGLNPHKGGGDWP